MKDIYMGSEIGVSLPIIDSATTNKNVWSAEKINNELIELNESKLSNIFEINKADPNDLVIDNNISINYYTGDSTYSSKPIPTASGFLITLCKDNQYARQLWVHMRSVNDSKVSRIWSRVYYGNSGWLDWVELATTSGIYSTEEVIVGTWINNKPIYRKTYELTDPSIMQKGTAFKVADLPTNFEMLVKEFGVIKTYENSYSNSDIIIYSTANAIMAKQNFTGYPEKMWVTVEYTKTTD